MAKVDIVVPSYNYGRFLERCVRSVLAQSISDVRILIIDDASSDDSVMVAERLAREDSRVSVTAHLTNRGHIETYNEGIEWASSDYFLLLSADDFLVPGALQRAIEIMGANPDIVLTYGDCVAWFDGTPMAAIPAVEGYSWAREDFLTKTCELAKNLVPTATAIARTSAQKAVGGYRKSLPHAGDMEMWLRFTAHGAVARINAVQAIYRKHSASMSNTYFPALISDFRQRQMAFDSFFDEYQDSSGRLRTLRVTAHRALADLAFRNGVYLLRRTQFKEGMLLIKCAMDMDHRLRYVPPLWQLLKPPGPEGRDFVKSALGAAATRLLGRGAARTDVQ